MSHAHDSALYAQWVELLGWLEAEAATRGLGFEKVADFPDYIYRMERPYDLPTTVMSVSLSDQGQPLLVAGSAPARGPQGRVAASDGRQQALAPARR